MLRFPFLAGAFLGLLFGIGAGLSRMGVGVPAPMHAVGGAHGPLMVSGFLLTVITLERAVAAGVAWAYLAPALAAGSVIAGIFGSPLAPFLAVISSALLVAIFVRFIRLMPSAFHWVMMGGALCSVVGNSQWLLGAGIHSLVYWWIGFLLLTIVGERLELSRVSRPPPLAEKALVALALLFVACAMLGPDRGARLAGVAMVGLGAWLLRYDIARRTIRSEGLTRFIAACLLTGYFWLILAGAVLLLSGAQAAGPTYDAVLHSFFLGFVFSMIFGHAPIIFPAILGIRLPYSPRFYAHLVLLHVTLAARVAADFGWLVFESRSTFGMLNAASIGLFAVNMLVSALSVRRRAVR